MLLELERCHTLISTEYGCFFSTWFASRSSWCCLNWKCGHILISQEILSGKTPRDIYFVISKAYTYPTAVKANGRAPHLSRPKSQNDFYCEETSNISSRTGHRITPNPKYWSTEKPWVKSEFPKARLSNGMAHLFLLPKWSFSQNGQPQYLD